MKITSIGLSCLLILALGVACAGPAANKAPAATETPQPTADVQGTVDAAIAATSTVQSSVQAAVSTSVAATVTAMPPAPTPIPTEAVTSMTEEELAPAVDDSVQEAAAATTQATTSVAQAAADGVITYEELVMLYSYWIYADELIAYADELAAAYSDVYGELATETLALINQVEADLNAMLQQADLILPALEEIGAALEQDASGAGQVLGQLQAASTEAQAKAADAQGQSQAWSASLKTEVQGRVDQALAVQPQQVADSRKAAIQSALDYASSVRAALEDMLLTQAELANIAQLGANAAASLTAQGGAQLAKLATSVNAITAQVAAGQLSAALASLQSFQAALPALP